MTKFYDTSESKEPCRRKEKNVAVEIPPRQMCLKCGARRSPDSHPDEPMCDAHLLQCEKCGATPEPDTDPPMCVDCLRNHAGVPPVLCFCDWLNEVLKLTNGGNDPETETKQD